MLVVLLGLLMSQGVVWYTAQFYTQFFLERVIKVEPRIVNELILSVTVVSALLHIFFARLSDRVGAQASDAVRGWRWRRCSSFRASTG